MIFLLFLWSIFWRSTKSNAFIVMYKVGLTGGIGSGKTTIGKIFEILGVPVYNSDLRARYLINHHPEIIKAYQSFFGSDVYSNGELDRARVADVVFKNVDLLNQVQAIVHPFVHEDFCIWADQQTASVLLKESAVLFEGGGVSSMDDVLTVTAPLNLRIQRVADRDQVSEEEVMTRVNNQWSDEKKMALSRYVIHADDSHLVIPQVLDVYQQMVAIGLK
jgi:dephospho-CoA kinase